VYLFGSNQRDNVTDNPVTPYAPIGLLAALLSVDCAYGQSSPVMEFLAQAKALTPDAADGRILSLKHCTGVTAGTPGAMV
jgi:hypothetical protein